MLLTTAYVPRSRTTVRPTHVKIAFATSSVVHPNFANKATMPSLGVVAYRLLWVYDGWTAVTSMPCCSASIAKDVAKWETKALLQPYMLANGVGCMYVQIRGCQYG